ncbi:ASAH1 protein [Acanthamoeba castellanii str. Neff]|uniref:N-acylethanolamine-hydrolyzing acid amidase n=1 Tax=Acanthamoeba castellanii (strain ATCC 30010 / Neff) TaxID=1257118 RepID=L8H3S3_ACACF|nr:ASAH1 protein [Acanthamoeba castellanii str. Neff]ELR19388.1 ASAH1 protein [Acanthamoeba castellanii str. Neff]
MEASTRWLMLLALFAFATSSASASFVPSGEAGLNDAVPQRWTVNLDLPPEQRWPWPAMLPYYGGALEHAVEMIGQFIPKEYTSVIVGIAEEIGRMGYLGEYGGEIASVAKAANMSLGEAVLLNLIYEIEAGCTSIVAQGTDGTIYHGRNLDFNLAGLLRNLTIEVDFQSKGQTVFTATTYAGYVGVLTGMRPGAFSISLDQRESGSPIENILMALFVPGTTASCFLIRNTLRDKTTFADAVSALSNTPLAAPAYIIVGGTQSGEGAVITRDREYARDVWYIDVNDGRWFEVETNDDHWRAPDDHRRGVANQGMERLGWTNVGLKGIFDVLSTHPVLNGGTTYTTLMSASLGNYSTVVRS